MPPNGRLFGVPARSCQQPPQRSLRGELDLVALATIIGIVPPIDMTASSGPGEEADARVLAGWPERNLGSRREQESRWQPTDGGKTVTMLEGG
jgi:hypothetical protein